MDPVQQREDRWASGSGMQALRLGGDRRVSTNPNPLPHWAPNTPAISATVFFSPQLLIRVQWVAGTEHQGQAAPDEYYLLEKKIAGEGGYAHLKWVSSSEPLEYDDTNLLPDTAYLYRVRACSSNHGCSAVAETAACTYRIDGLLVHPDAETFRPGDLFWIELQLRNNGVSQIEHLILFVTLSIGEGAWSVVFRDADPRLPFWIESREPNEIVLPPGMRPFTLVLSTPWPTDMGEGFGGVRAELFSNQEDPLVDLVWEFSYAGSSAG
jgi:hypothetical protein